MLHPRVYAGSVLLSGGRVLNAGGYESIDAPNHLSASAEIYDPVSNSWKAAAPLSQARYAHEMMLLADNQVLAAGGARDWDCCWNSNSFVHEIEVYDPALDCWHVAGALPQAEVWGASVLLPDGRVWVTGGQAGNVRETYWSTTWLLTPILKPVD